MHTFEKIIALLDTHHMQYTALEHEPTPTSADSARIRKTPLSEGAKAMVLRSSGRFFMCVLSADKKIDFSKVKKILQTKSVSLATPEEVKDITGCVIGGVPPFGNLFHIPLYIDRSVLRSAKINFNAGLQTKSILMQTTDYLNVVDGQLDDFSL